MRGGSVCKTEMSERLKTHAWKTSFPPRARLRASARTVETPVASSNVIEGSDPRLRNEHVVVSAHLDGQGIGKPVNSDRIYNSAFDNASGVAALLDIAAVLTSEGTRPKRSVLFAFFTGHEKDLLGSKYFVAHPTVNAKRDRPRASNESGARCDQKADRRLSTDLSNPLNPCENRGEVDARIESGNTLHSFYTVH